MATFNYSPDFVDEEEIEHSTLISEFENLSEQRRNVAGPRRAWRLRFLNRNQAEFEALRDFYLARSGAFEAFNWTNPNDSVTYQVRFKEQSIKPSRKKGALYDLELDFIEVL